MSSDQLGTSPPSNNGPESPRSISFGTLASGLSRFLKSNVSPSSVRSSRGSSPEVDLAEKEKTFEIPPLEPIILDGYLSTTRSRLLKPEVAEQLRNFLPSRLQLRSQWQLVYSLEQHGASLTTLYDRNRPPPGQRPGYILVVKDRDHNIFGAYSNEHFRPSDFKRFFGNGDCFLWKTYEVLTEIKNEEKTIPQHETRVRVFPYTGENDFLIFCTPQFLSMGGGDGHYGLWVDNNLESGISNRSLTFGNDLLSDSGPKFDIIGLEVWRI